ncbi:MAG: threonine synthase [Clostridia bacterium]|nr:threonine synthase [Clostridia bacterium]
MNFCSTRNRDLRVTSAQAILQGLSEDGGLFLPTQLPAFSAQQIEEMAGQDYRQVAATVLGAFLPDYTADEIVGFVNDAYGKQFTAADVAPVKAIQPGVYSLELWHGPTCAFKDFALQMLPRLLPAAAKKCGSDKTVAILVATSGDTGKAALEGFADVEGTRICVFYPHGGTSEMQRLQMVTQTGGNVNVFAVKGNFDDTQNGVKAIFTDTSVAKELEDRGVMLSSANSINWGRLAPQIAYYYWAYAQLLKQGKIKMGDKINFSVPTGNFGDILAGYLAKKSGLPVDKLICASNENNVLTDFLKTGVYDRNRKFHLTDSPSMDILISSNLERLLYMITDGNDIVVRNWMEQLKKTGKYDVGPNVLAKLKEEGFVGYWCNDERTEITVHDTWFAKGYLCDTHTGVAVDALEQYTKETGDQTPCVVVSTASPFKFAPAILPAMDLDFQGTDFQMLEAMEIVSCMPAPKALTGLKNKEVRFDKVIEKDAMKQEVLDWLK